MPPEKPRHRVVLDFDGGIGVKLICPPGGCEPASTCGECHRHIDDPEPDNPPCPFCPDPDGTECWVKTWFDNVDAEELLHGAITVEVDAEWDGDHLIATLGDVVKEAPDGRR